MINRIVGVSGSRIDPNRSEWWYQRQEIPVTRDSSGLFDFQECMIVQFYLSRLTWAISRLRRQHFRSLALLQMTAASAMQDEVKAAAYGSRVKTGARMRHPKEGNA